MRWPVAATMALASAGSGRRHRRLADAFDVGGAGVLQRLGHDLRHLNHAKARVVV
jgi:hypothetical protein